jgi:uncharacterized RDD family membrane protein YckC
VIPADPAYAGIVSRGLAFGIDALIAVGAATIGLQAALAALSVLDLTNGSSIGGAAAVSYVVTVPLVFVAYCAGLWALWGRTIGMVLLGIRVVTGDGGTPGVARSLVRAFGYWLSAILFLGFLWIGVDRRSQGFHDKLAGTFVVYDEPAPASS